MKSKIITLVTVLFLTLQLASANVVMAQPASIFKEDSSNLISNIVTKILGLFTLPDVNKTQSVGQTQLERAPTEEEIAASCASLTAEECQELRAEIAKQFPVEKTTAPQTGTSDGVKKLVADIQASCSEGGQAGRVTARNQNCIDAISPPLSVLVSEKIKRGTDAGDTGYLQCVGFAYAAVAHTTGESIFCSGGCAKDFAVNRDCTGRTFHERGSTRTIGVGDLPIWGGSCGHIAYVTEVYDINTFQIAEANFDVQGSVRLENKTLSDPNLLGWFSKN